MLLCTQKKRGAETHGQKSDGASRKNLFSKHEEISEGPPTVSRHYLNNVLTLSFIRDRDTLTDRQRERQIARNFRSGTLFSLSFCIKVRASE